ncbi:hypothetical protein PISMIDRAFT_13967 [Pisolithus microcarpus 441]|uniref:Uncharacterized protein n=1 Tax=Pisolithus microcarpus 441 TaxID=765257 RepID=A0A0C9Y2V2_9AGAM|nr:hypothetical protein BKA83DRAFT_13967 [Pisolithus microcarpus]KIK19000.1 hypothetical protein PISMIDRAFT_13967 [Pisolithus microcarpus 441]
MTIRPLNVVYFNGTGAARLSSGTLDSQDIVAWGDARPDWSMDRARFHSFEVMLCNFTSSVRVVSFSNIGDPVMSRNTSRRFSPTFEFMYAGSRHNRYPGETRVRLEEALSRPAGSLVVMQYLLNSTDTNNYEPDSMIGYALKTQVRLRHMLMPYVGLNAVPRLSGANVKGKASDVLDWDRPVYKLCATAHTDRLQDCMMTSPGNLLLEAVQGMTREICRVMTKMWGLGVFAGVGQFIGTDRKPDVETTQKMMNTWRKDVNELMACLDRNAYVKYRPEFGPEEMCYLTTWPVGFPLPHDRARIPRPDESGVPPLLSQSVLDPTPMPTATPPPWRGGTPTGEPAEDLQRPQPRYIRRADPYNMEMRVAASKF